MLKAAHQNRLTVSEVNQDFSLAQSAVVKGPLVITKRGKPSLVLMTYDDYVRSTGKTKSLIELLHVPGLEDYDFEEFPRLDGKVNPAVFD
jgi:prevent-host-death family protein